MSTEELLKIEPSVLTFQFELNKQASCSIRLSNNTQKRVAFKVMTTNPKKYWVQFNVGIISPRSTKDITVTMQSQKKAPPSMQCKDKFLIQSIVPSSGATVEDFRSLFNKEGHPIQKCKLEVVYNIVPQVPSSIPDGSLSNVTENRVAFKVKTTNTIKYCVIPSKGFVLPRSTCDITVKMQAQNEFPPDVKCSDKFLIQSIVANAAATTNDIPTDMFNKCKECKLRVEYVFWPHPPSTMTSEEGSSWNVSNVEARNSSNPKVVPGHDRIVNNGRDVILGLIIIGLFGIVIWCIMKMAMLLIGSLIFLMTTVVIKMVNKMVSDSVEDWVVKALFYIFVHFLFGRRNNVHGL
ncbi:Vesicle-associated 1-2 [Olea europaea subsp. europaea]|uniref:Vesicle-associated 1-2 n=1 Tax=Olea europaea subsp. europaea TaxID=158383 RepID=A0A8S0Q2Z6_OLEEU|nr:Vesicle-associated 1-2 [Olea europaea subsp. europaea]